MPKPTDSIAHTPGPWRWEHVSCYHNLVGADGTTVCDDGSACSEYPPTIDVNGPNARLIAAAPEMLQALKALISHPAVLAVLAPRESLGSLLALAEGAIRKAEGR